MFRQSASKLLRGAAIRSCNSSRNITNETPQTPCKHHKDLVPPFETLKNLKNFELKSDCATFHMKSCGNDQNKKDDPCSKLKA